MTPIEVMYWVMVGLVVSLIASIAIGEFIRRGRGPGYDDPED